MRKYLPVISFGIVFIVGLSVMLYPLVSDFVNARTQSRAIAIYNEELAKVSKEDYTALLEQAYEYNQSLLKKTNPFIMTDEDLDEYHSLLGISSRGVLGTLVISAIDVNLPIYKGTGVELLQNGIGHLEGSSLPVGGPSTHSVLTGHRGLPSATLLTNLDRLTYGDIFVLNIFNEELMYEVDQITVVEPEDFSTLQIEEGIDYCTLVTCTPYGINTHRLLVRGHRVAAIEDTSVEAVVVVADAVAIDNLHVMLVVSTPLLVAMLIYILIKYRKRKGRS